MDGGGGSLICPIILPYIDEINDKLQFTHFLHLE
jgi:hypothetical protein